MVNFIGQLSDAWGLRLRMDESRLITVFDLLASWIVVATMDYVIARKNMVESQIRTNKVTSAPLIEALLDLPREAFAPDALKANAYIDDDLPVAPGRFLMQPMALARLLQAAGLQPADKALDLGGATGYSAALISYLAGSVVAVEAEGDLVHRASKLLEKYAKAPVTLLLSDPCQGSREHGPYNVIFLAGAVEYVPETLLEQLAEGGCLLTVLQTGPVGRARLYRRQGNSFLRQELFDAHAPLLPGFTRKAIFAF